MGSSGINTSMNHAWATLLLLPLCAQYHQAQRIPAKYLRNRRPNKLPDHRRTISGLFQAVQRPPRTRPKPVQTEYVNSVPFTYATTPLPKVSPFYMIVAPDLSKQKPNEYGAPSSGTYAQPPPISYNPTFQTSSSTIDYSSNQPPLSTTLPPVYSPKTETAFSSYGLSQQQHQQQQQQQQQQHIIPQDDNNHLAGDIGDWPPLFYNTIQGTTRDGFIL